MKANVRYQQTEDKIRKTVVRLINQEGLAKITVRQITQEANINRTTFYRHYLDKPDLVEQYRNQILKQFKTIIDDELNNSAQGLPEATITNLYPLFKRVILLVDGHWEFCRAWLGRNGDQETVQQILELINTGFVERVNNVETIQQFAPVIPLNFAQKFIVDQLWSILTIWFQQENRMSATEIINIIMKTRFMSPFELLGLDQIEDK